VRYRIALKTQGDKTVVSVLTSAGAADTGENGQRIAAQLVNDLK
jgi:outer membrane protein assembly factor BamC